MVTPLDRKLGRDLFHMKAQVVTIALVIAVGIANLVGMLSTYESLYVAKDSFYNHSRFANIFAVMKRAPLRTAHRLQNLEGVNAVEHRLVFDQIVDFTQIDEPAVGRFISLPPNNLGQLNLLHLKSGRWPLTTSHNEVLVSEAFFNANQLKLDTEFYGMFNGRYKKLRVVGVAVSPEYIYTLQGSSPMPDDKHFGIFWIHREVLAASYDMSGAFNSISLQVSHNSNLERIIEQVDEIIKPYGGIGTQSRQYQVSNFFIENELNQLRIQAVFVPFIFLSVAAFLLNVVLSRMVSAQREQVATFKAIGYTNSVIGVHYFKLAFVITSLGGVIGLIGGYYYAKYFTELYTQYFRFPLLVHLLPTYLPISALLVSFTAAGIGVITSLLHIFRMTPAEAMRPPMPPNYSHNLIERLSLTRLFSISGRMILRGLSQRPIRSLLTTVGVGFALMIVMLGLFWQDSIMHLVHIQFGIVQKEDAQVVFTNPVTDSALYELRNLKGVNWSEGYRNIPVKISYGTVEKNSSLLGLPQQRILREVLDTNYRSIAVPQEGYIMSASLAKSLGLRTGNTFRMEVLEGQRPTKLIRLDRIADDFLGQSLYASQKTVNTLLKEGNSYNLASLTIDKRHSSLLYAKLKQLPKVASISFKESVLAIFNETSVKMLLGFAFFLTLFSMIIAFGIVYNSARISLAERSWELASLQVLGFRVSEVFTLLMGEIALLMLMSVPLGWWLGHWSNRKLIEVSAPENMNFPFFIENSTYLYSALVLAFSGLFSGIVIYQRVKRLDFNAALKARG